MTNLHKALYWILVSLLLVVLVKEIDEIMHGQIPDFYDVIAMGFACVVIITVTAVQFIYDNKQQP
jgi:uncharacterized membrane protein YoaK (UPF0700 family)